MQPKNKEYRYAFDTSNYEYGDRIIFLYDSEISESDFKEICDECIAKAVHEYITTTPMHAYNAITKEMMTVSSRSYGDPIIELWGDTLYKDLDEHLRRVIELMKDKGFIVEKLPLVTSFHANVYTYINETHGDNIDVTLKTRCETENLPIFNSIEDEEKAMVSVSTCDSVKSGINVLNTFR